MKTMHLFAGAGGGLLADLILGHDPIIAVEWDKYACKVLRERASEGWFPNLSVWEGDVRLFDPSKYAGKVDCIHAGFPCVDISNAGKQAGLGEGTRSGLYREVLRIAGIVRPRYIFLENVSAIINLGLGTVLADLSAMGYDAKWLTIRASDVGAPHGRDRWFCLAELAHPDSIGHIHGESEIQPAEGRIDAQCHIATSSEDVAYTNSAQCQGTELSERSKQEYPDIGKPGWWEIEPNVDRVVDGVASRVDRLKSIGNGQVPIQAAVAFSILMKK